MPLYTYTTKSNITNPLVSYVYLSLSTLRQLKYIFINGILYIVSRTQSRAIFNKHIIFGSCNWDKTWIDRENSIKPMLFTLISSSQTLLRLINLIKYLYRLLGQIRLASRIWVWKVLNVCNEVKEYYLLASKKILFF